MRRASRVGYSGRVIVARTLRRGRSHRRRAGVRRLRTTPRQSAVSRTDGPRQYSVQTTRRRSYRCYFCKNVPAHFIDVKTSPDPGRLQAASQTKVPLGKGAALIIATLRELDGQNI